MSKVVLEITFHETETPPWAEWEFWREFDGMTEDGHSEWIANGTGPSLEGCIDKAVEIWLESNTGSEPDA